MTIKTSFNIKPDDGIFKNIIIKTIGMDNMTLLQKISQDESIFFKIVSSDSVEYKIYKAIKSLKNNIPNTIKIYGSFGCSLKKKSYEKIKKKYESITGEIVNLKLCDSYETNSNKPYQPYQPNQSNSQKQIDLAPYIKLKFIALESLTNYTRIDDFLTNKVLPDNMFLSIYLQGLYQLFNYYNTLGIIHGDYNDGNILVSYDNTLVDETIQYKFGTCPFRTYKNMWSYCDVFTYYDDKIIDIKTHGMKLMLIDFDNSMILHTDYAEPNDFSKTKYNINPRINLFHDLKKYTTTMYKYASPKIKKKLEKLHNAPTYNIFINNYNLAIEEANKREMDYISNDMFLQKTSYLFQHYISYIVIAFNLPLEYRIKNSTVL